MVEVCCGEPVMDNGPVCCREFGEEDCAFCGGFGAVATNQNQWPVDGDGREIEA